MMTSSIQKTKCNDIQKIGVGGGGGGGATKYRNKGIRIMITHKEDHEQHTATTSAKQQQTENQPYEH